MKVLVVCSGNFGSVSPFIQEQIDSLKIEGVDVCTFLIKGKGIIGYLSNLPRFYKVINDFNPDIIHSHYGFSAFFANIQRRKPVISTFHGSDLLISKKHLFISKIAHRLSKYSIVVNKKMISYLNSEKIEVLPCGVNLEVFYPIEPEFAKDIMAHIIKKDKINILFSSRFNYFEKNYPLAKKVIETLGDQFNLIELKGYSRNDVNLLMNACDLVLMTSISEGSPQFIKESMACNTPIVSTDVGDVKWLIGDIDGCFITTFDPNDIAAKIKLAISFRKSVGKTNTRERINELGLDNTTVVNNLLTVYTKVLS